MKVTKAASWLSKQCKFAQMSIGFVGSGGGDEACDSPDEPNKPVRSHVQWMTGDNKFFIPASEVVKKLPAGFYKIELDMSGTPIFIRQNPWKEKLIKFPETACDTVVAEIEKFWDKEADFRDAKLAYKRGLLLYGPPGSGKSSAIKLAMRNIIKRGGLVLEFGYPSSFRKGLETLREIQPETPVIALMEDLDAILDRNNESDVLNIIDGAVPVDKCIFLATTNYMERLSSRITNRPSRFDKRFEIGMPNDETRRIYLQEICGEKIGGKELDRWVTDTEGLSIAHLKELVVSVNILDYKYDDAIAALKGLKQKVYSDEYMENHPQMAIVKIDGDRQMKGN